MRIVCGIVILLGLVGATAAGEAFGQRQRPRPPRPGQPVPESPVEAVKKSSSSFVAPGKQAIVRGFVRCALPTLWSSVRAGAIKESMPSSRV